jgi:hypothetical protein
MTSCGLVHLAGLEVPHQLPEVHLPTFLSFDFCWIFCWIDLKVNYSLLNALIFKGQNSLFMVFFKVSLSDYLSERLGDFTFYFSTKFSFDKTLDFRKSDFSTQTLGT